MKHIGKILTFIAFMLTSSAPTFAVDAENISTFSIPISFDLASLEKKLNALIPDRLATINEKQTCVKARYAKVLGKSIKVTPKIRCTIKGHVDRRGAATLTAKGNQFEIKLPVKATMSGKAVGIRETANAEATFYVTAIPHIDEKWKLSLKVKTDYRWNKKPELKLFGIVKVRITGLVDPKLKKKLKEFGDKIPSMIEKLQIQNKIEKTWARIQKPIKISNNPLAYVNFKPTQTGFSGFTTQDKHIKTRITIAGVAHTSIGKPSPDKPLIPLLPLKKVSLADSGFQVKLPIFIPNEAVQAEIDKRLKKELKLDIDESLIQGKLTAKNIQTSISKENGILLKSKISFKDTSAWYSSIDFFDWFTFNGDVSIQLLAKIDGNKQEIIITKANFTSSTDNVLADGMLQVLNLPIVKDEFLSSFKYNYSKHAKSALADANKAINNISNKDFDIKANVAKIGAQGLTFMDQMIVVTALSEGNVSLSLKK